MKANSGERHLILRFTEATTAIINGFPNDSSKTEVLLGITINQKLSLMIVLTIYAKKASQKLNALVHIAPFMNVSKGRIVMKLSFTRRLGTVL